MSVQHRTPYAVTEIIESKGQLGSITDGKSNETIADRIEAALGGKAPREGDSVKYRIASKGKETFTRRWDVSGGWVSY